jgi:hypothetical protein
VSNFRLTVRKRKGKETNLGQEILSLPVISDLGELVRDSIRPTARIGEEPQVSKASEASRMR